MRILVQTDEPSGRCKRVVRQCLHEREPGRPQTAHEPQRAALAISSLCRLRGLGIGAARAPKLNAVAGISLKLTWQPSSTPIPDSVWPRLIRQRDLKWM